MSHKKSKAERKREKEAYKEAERKLGLPPTVENIEFLLGGLKLCSGLINMLWKGVNKDNLFAIGMARRSAEPEMRKFIAFAEDLEWRYVETQRDNLLVPVQVSETLSRAQAALDRSEPEVIDAEWEDAEPE